MFGYLLFPTAAGPPYFSFFSLKISVLNIIFFMGYGCSGYA
jgi:hypothetical protein